MEGSRTPHGVRGLKSWLPSLLNGRRASHPTRGAWIEIVLEYSIQKYAGCRTPHGVRGLK